MKINKKTILLLISIFIVFVPIYAQEQAIPELKSRVTDLTGTLMQNEISVLEQKLTLFEETDGSQFVVLIVSTTGSETIEEYSMRVAEDWKIGQKDIDDGIILLISKIDRKLRIEVGYGLEAKLTDAYAKRVIDEYIVPKFKTGDFNEGINAGVDEIIKLINGTSIIPTTPPASENHVFDNLRESFITLLSIMFVIAILLILKKVRTGSFGGLSTSNGSFNSDYDSSDYDSFDDDGFGGGGGDFGGGGASGDW